MLGSQEKWFGQGSKGLIEIKEALLTFGGPEENYETKIFCVFLRAESKFEDCFLLSALEHRKIFDVLPNFWLFLGIFSYFFYVLVLTKEYGLQIWIQHVKNCKISWFHNFYPILLRRPY